MINNKNSGLSILEALVSTAIVGIGFIAILQMTNFSVQSIDNSGERTKANFITTMIVEDVIGNRNTFYKKKADEMGAPNAANPKFSEHLAGNAWSAENCVKSTEGTDDQEDVDATKDIYKAQKDNAPENKIDKWQAVFTKGRFLKCKSNKETKKLQALQADTFGIRRFSCAVLEKTSNFQKMSVLNPNSDDEPQECPLCMEFLELDDINFYPCSCGYQVR